MAVGGGPSVGRSLSVKSGKFGSGGKAGGTPGGGGGTGGINPGAFFGGGGGGGGSGGGGTVGGGSVLVPYGIGTPVMPLWQLHLQLQGWPGGHPDMVTA